MIRQYRDQDLDDLLATWEAASEIAHPFLTQEFLDLERENIPNLYLPNAETWVCEDEGRVVGFVALLGNEVGAIFVHPSHQRRGVGRQLMDKAKELRGELVVEVFKANMMGRAFYAKYGFETIAEKVHEQTGFHLLQMQLPSPERVSSVTEPVDSQMALVFSLYEGVERKGPGSEASTLKALSMLDGLPPSPRIVDFGCGAGAASLVLAKRGRVTAVDIHQPFLDQLNALAARQGLGDCIETIQGDLVAPPFPDESFDLVWSEGAIYFAGFEQGLKRWRRLLGTGGLVAVTEATWLCETPPRKALDFWMTEYPAMTNIEDNVRTLRSAGFEPVGHFVLPTEDWENFFGPLAEQLACFRSEKAGCAEAQAFANSVQREIDLWQECGGSYGYVFYLGRAI